MSEHDKDTGNTNIQMFNHNKIGDVVVAIAPALLPWTLFFMALVTLFIGVYWFSHPTNFIALVFNSVNTVAGFLSILMWLLVCGVGAWVLNYVLNHVLLPFLHSVVALFKHTPTVHAFNDRFAVYSDERGSVQVHDHIEDARRLPPPAASLALPPGNTTEPVFKTFAQLLNDGTIPTALKSGQLCMGYMFDAATKVWAMRYGTWLDLYSCAVAGVSGSGKTTTVLFILLQAIMAGAKMLIIDPHLADPEESLAARLEVFNGAMLLEPCDHTPREVLRRVRGLRKELARRIQYGLKPPVVDRVVFVVDEFNSIMQKGGIVAEELQALLVEIEQEGRKFGMFAMLIGQNWSANSIGDALIRQCLASALVHRMSEVAQAKKLLPLSKHANSTIELDQGYWIFKDTHGKFATMYTPLTTEDDSPNVALLLPPSMTKTRETSSDTSVKPDRNQFTEQGSPYTVITVETSSETSSENQFTSALEAKLAQVVHMQSEGVQKPDIMRHVWDVTPSKSDKYTQANTEWLAIMREIQRRLRVVSSVEG